MKDELKQNELNQEQLETVAGGQGNSKSESRAEQSTIATGWDIYGNEIQWKKGGEYFHNVCGVCKKEIVHKGTGGYYYCDRCDAIRLTRMDSVTDAGPWGHGHSRNV
ncbi:MAG: hypothetical protein PUC32_05945 [Oscillospiraceae bacterium]|nr:hypothetical protein [Oscillospiraceae bacterium]